jgi:hypothetical protein
MKALTLIICFAAATIHALKMTKYPSTPGNLKP